LKNKKNKKDRVWALRLSGLVANQGVVGGVLKNIINGVCGVALCSL